MDASFSPTDSGVIVTVSLTGAVRVWDGTGNESYSQRFPNEQLEGVEFSKDGQSVIISERFGRLRVLEAGTWTETSALDTRSAEFLVKCSPSDAGVAATAGTDGVIRFLDISPAESILDHPFAVRSLEFSPDGKILSVGMANGAVQFWNVANKSRIFATEELKMVNPFQLGMPNLEAFRPDFVAFSPDSAKAAIVGPRRTVTLWDLQSEESEAVINVPYDQGRFWSVAFSPDGADLYTGAADNGSKTSILVWDLKDPHSPVAKFNQSGDLGAFCMANSADQMTLASGQRDVKLWDISSKKTLRSLRLDGLTDMTRAAVSLGFSPDGKWLAAGDAGDSVWLWNTSTWKHNLLPLRLNVLCVDFSAESDRLVAADMSGMTKLWDVQTRQVVATYHGSVAEFSPDGTVLAVGCEDLLSSHMMPGAGRVRLYHAPPLAEIDRPQQEAAR